MHTKSFFKTLFFSFICFMFCCAAFPAWAQLKCNPKTDKCNPVMESWCIENKEVLSKASQQSTYVYHDVQCNSEFCCISSDQGKVPYFLKGIMDVNNAGVDCWLCPLLEKIFVMGNILSTSIYKTESAALLVLDGVFFAIMVAWLAFRVFVDFSGKTARTFIQKQAGLMMKLAIVALLLIQPPRTAGKWILDPFISLGSGLGLEIMKNSGTGSAHVNYVADHMDDENCYLGCTKQPDSSWKSDQMFSKPDCNALVGLVQIMSIEIYTPLQYGQAIWRWAIGDFSDLSWGKFFGALGTSVVIIIAFAIILVMTPLKVVDIFVQLAVVGCLMPLAIALFVFPSTRNYTQGVWKMFLSCLIQLVMLSLMVALCVSMFTGSIDEKVFQYFLTNQNEKAYNAIGLGGTGFWVILALAYVGAKMIGKASTFAQQLGGGVNLGLGEMMSAPVIAATSAGAGFAVGSTKRTLATQGAKIWNRYKHGTPAKSGPAGATDAAAAAAAAITGKPIGPLGSGATGAPTGGDSGSGTPSPVTPPDTSSSGSKPTGDIGGEKASKEAKMDLKSAPEAAKTEAKTAAEEAKKAAEIAKTSEGTKTTESSAVSEAVKAATTTTAEVSKSASGEGVTYVDAGRKRDLLKATMANAGVLGLTAVELLMGRSPTDVSNAGSDYDDGTGNTNNQNKVHPAGEKTDADKKPKPAAPTTSVSSSTASSSSRTAGEGGKVVETVTESKTTTRETTGGEGGGDTGSA